MADYMGTRVEFGGIIRAGDLDRLAGVMLHNGRDELIAAAREERAALTSGQTAYGMASELCSTLAELGLSYRRHSEAKYDRSADVEMFEPETGKYLSATSDHDGEALLSLRSLREIKATGGDLDSAIARLERIEKPLPPLTIARERGQGR
jgi:hypothetical protein